MKHFVFLMLSAASLDLFAADFNAYDGPMPAAVFIETNPWAMVLGADTPRVVFYEDGTVIFARISGDEANYFQKVLSATELAEFRKQLLPTTQLQGLKPFYNLSPGVSDQPEALFYLREAGGELTTRVYGLAAAEGELPGYTVRPGKKDPDAPPRELLELHKYLCTVNYPGSQKWTPNYLEVMVWPYEYAPESSIHWPKDWPGLDSKRSFRRGDSYSIFLDGSELSNLQRFLRTRREKGAVEIGGKKWAASYRFVFPSAPVWMAGFRGKRDSESPD